LSDDKDVVLFADGVAVAVAIMSRGKLIVSLYTRPRPDPKG